MWISDPKRESGELLQMIETAFVRNLSDLEFLHQWDRFLSIDIEMPVVLTVKTRRTGLRRHP
jgi:hypothetical protein